MKSAKETMKVGITSIVGQSVIGTLGSKVPGSLSSVKTINAGLQLTNVGQLAKTAKKII